MNSMKIYTDLAIHVFVNKYINNTILYIIEKIQENVYYYLVQNYVIPSD